MYIIESTNYLKVQVLKYNDIPRYNNF